MIGAVPGQSATLAQMLARMLRVKDHPDARFAARSQLAALLQFLEGAGLDYFDPGMPLRRLAIALSSLDQGTIEPMLKPVDAGKQGRRRSAREDLIRRTAVLATDILVEGGKTVDDACAEVATALRRAGFRLRAAHDPSRAEITRQTVKNWRRVPRDREAERVLADIRKLGPPGHKEAAKWLLEDLAEKCI